MCHNLFQATWKWFYTMPLHVTWNHRKHWAKTFNVSQLVSSFMQMILHIQQHWNVNLNILLYAEKSCYRFLLPNRLIVFVQREFWLGVGWFPYETLHVSVKCWVHVWIRCGGFYDEHPILVHWAPISFYNLFPCQNEFGTDESRWNVRDRNLHTKFNHAPKTLLKHGRFCTQSNQLTTKAPSWIEG